MKSSWLMHVLADANRKCGYTEYAKELERTAQNFEVIEEAEEIASGSDKRKTN